MHPSDRDQSVGVQELKLLRDEIGDEMGRRLIDSFQNNASDYEKILRFHFDWPLTGTVAIRSGKKTRPLLTMIVANAVCGRHEHVLAEAVCLELIHNASLILDDVMDRDEVRRGRPSVWKRWNQGMATTAGVALFTGALSGYERATQRPDARARAILLDAATETCMAQLIDLQMETEIVREVEKTINVAVGRCALMTAATQLGALLSGANDVAVEEFREFGRCLSVARALSNDYRDIWGAIDETGNPAGGDIFQRKKTFPLVYALQHSTAAVRDELLEFFLQSRAISQDDVIRICALLSRAGANRATLEEIETHRSRALQHLDAAGIRNPWTAYLRNLLYDASLTAVN